MESINNVDDTLIIKKNNLILKLNMLSNDIDRLKFKIENLNQKFKFLYLTKHKDSERLKALEKEYNVILKELETIIETLTNP